MHTAAQIVLPHMTDYCRPCQTNVLCFSIAFSMFAKQFLLSAAKDQKALTSSKLQFIDATVKSELFVHKGNHPDRDSGSFPCSSAIILVHYVTCYHPVTVPYDRCIGLCHCTVHGFQKLYSKNVFIHCYILRRGNEG